MLITAEATGGCRAPMSRSLSCMVQVCCVSGNIDDCGVCDGTGNTVPKSVGVNNVVRTCASLTCGPLHAR